MHVQVLAKTQTKSPKKYRTTPFPSRHNSDSKDHHHVVKTRRSHKRYKVSQGKIWDLSSSMLSTICESSSATDLDVSSNDEDEGDDWSLQGTNPPSTPPTSVDLVPFMLNNGAEYDDELFYSAVSSWSITPRSSFSSIL